MLVLNSLPVAKVRIFCLKLKPEPSNELTRHEYSTLKIPKSILLRRIQQLTTVAAHRQRSQTRRIPRYLLCLINLEYMNKRNQNKQFAFYTSKTWGI